jgi:hypothetical protein
MREGGHPARGHVSVHREVERRVEIRRRRQVRRVYKNNVFDALFDKSWYSQQVGIHFSELADAVAHFEADIPLAATSPFTAR